jgi:peptide/nickel transport system substrate-binding protein
MKNGTGTARWVWWVAFSVIAALIVLVMIQIDRQWQRMGDMTRVMQEQAEDIRRTRGLLRDLEESLRNAEFRSAAPGAFAGASSGSDAFARARRAAVAMRNHLSESSKEGVTSGMNEPRPSLGPE